MRKKLAALTIVAASITGSAPLMTAQAVVLEIHTIKAHGRPSPTTSNCSPDGATDSSEYDTIGWAVSGARTTHFNVASIPSGLNATAVTAAMQAGYDVWTGPAPAITVATNGSATRASRNNLWEVAFGRTSGGSIAVTYTWSSGGVVLESDTIFNSKLPWYIAPEVADGCDTAPKYDVQNIAAHEFGHTFGLDHPNPGRFETMYAYGFTGETLKRTPGAGDDAGIAAVYP